MKDGVFVVTAQSKKGAIAQINKHLTEQGVGIDDPNRSKQFSKIWDDNKVSELPQDA